MAVVLAGAVWLVQDRDTPTVPGSGGRSAGSAAQDGTGATLRPVDGGPDYYGQFAPALPSDPSFFPLAVWMESVTDPADTASDRAAGLNTYVELTRNSDLSLVRAAGMYAITGPTSGHGEETVGWFVSDEADMWAGPGEEPWTGRYPGQGDICRPKDSRCGYRVQRDIRSRLPNDKRLRLANYGKGVAFWESDAEAARFVNEFQDVVAVDTYWFTDLGICAQHEGGGRFEPAQLVPGPHAPRLPPELCHRAANYGRTVDHVRSLVQPPGSKPVWNFVEVGHPFSEEDYPSMQPAELTAAVWASIIHGARGIVYFNHSFGGPCVTQHALREPCYAGIRAAVTAVNHRITALVPVLNAPTVDNVTTVTGPADVATKWHDGHFYLLAGATGTGPQQVTVALPCVGDAQVTVLDEGRVLPAPMGTFTDTFVDGNAVHLYRVDGGSSCGAS